MAKIRRSKRSRTPEWRQRPHFHVVERITDRSGREWLIGRVEFGCTTGLPHELIVTHCPGTCGGEIDTISGPTVRCIEFECQAALDVPAVVRNAADRVRRTIDEAREIRSQNEELLQRRFWGGGTRLGIPDC